MPMPGYPDDDDVGEAADGHSVRRTLTVCSGRKEGKQRMRRDKMCVQ